MFHDLACGRKGSVTATIAGWLKVDCPCCSIWRGVVLGVFLAGFAVSLFVLMSERPWIAALHSVTGVCILGLLIVSAIFMLDWIIGVIKAAPRSTGD